MRNAWMFHLVVILAAFGFCARPAHASGSLSIPSTGYNIAGTFYYTCETALQAQLIVFQQNRPTASRYGDVVETGNVCQETMDYGGWGLFTVTKTTTVCPSNSTGTPSTCICNDGFSPNAGATACVPSSQCSPPGALAGINVTILGESNGTICGADSCVYTTTGSISTGYALTPPVISTLVNLGVATGDSCTGSPYGGSSGCAAGLLNIGYGCKTNQQNIDAINALRNLGGYEDPCHLAGTCTPAVDACIAAGTCTGTGTGAGGTAGTVNPCIAAGTCSGSGTGTGSGSGGATETTLSAVEAGVTAIGTNIEATNTKLDSLIGATESNRFDLGNPPADPKIPVDGITVENNILSFLDTPVCPAPISYSMLTISREITYQPACDFLENMRPLILAFASITVLIIYIRGFTPS